MSEDYDNVDYDYFKEWDIEQYKEEIERLKQAAKDDYENYQEIMAQLSTEKEELQQRNDKAIEYIEDMQKAPSYCDTWSTTAPHDIICILKGSDKE